MRPAWLFPGLLLGAALAGCGPDCDRYCRKVLECQQTASPPVPVERQITVASCVLGCNDSGGDHADSIRCIIDHTCSDIAGGHCSVTGQPPR